MTLSQNNKIIKLVSLLSLVTIMTIVLSSCGGDFKVKYEVEPVVESQPTGQFLWDLRKRAFEQASDSFRKYSHAALIQLINGNNDSASYYRGKADAYYSCEEIIWPTNYPVKNVDTMAVDSVLVINPILCYWPENSNWNWFKEGYRPEAKPDTIIVDGDTETEYWGKEIVWKMKDIPYEIKNRSLTFRDTINDLIR